MERGKRNSRVVGVVASVSLFLTSSCSLFSSGTQHMTIQPSDPRAEIFVDGAPVGKGTVSVPMKKKRSHTVMAKCGDSTGVAHIDRSISTTGVLDIVGGVLILVPFLGVLGPGFYELEPEHVVVAVPDHSACRVSASTPTGNSGASIDGLKTVVEP